jgi:hypothetical protein
MSSLRAGTSLNRRLMSTWTPTLLSGYVRCASVTGITGDRDWNVRLVRYLSAGRDPTLSAAALGGRNRDSLRAAPSRFFIGIAGG